jgi:hypothetical protein
MFLGTHACRKIGRDVVREKRHDLSFLPLDCEGNEYF